jgi:hypothetical protein
VIDSVGFDAAVKVGVAAFCEGEQWPDDEEVWERLTAGGVEPWLAERLLIFLPMAYTRRLVPDVVYPDALVAPGGRLSLQDEPVFVAASARAQVAGGGEIERIATRSSEFNAINNGLNGGSQLSDLRLGETALVHDLEPVGPGDGGVPSPRAAFVSMLSRHGVALDDQTTIDAQLFARPAQAGAVRVQVDFSVVSPALAGSRLVESFAGYGANWREAIGQTVTKFERCSLHPIVNGLLRPGAAADQVERERYEHPDGVFDLVLGGQLNLYADRPVPPAGAVLDLLLSALRGQGLSRKVHGLRLFQAFRDGRLQNNEVLLDSKPWPEGEAAVAGTQAPLPDGLVAVRMFGLLVPADDA